MKQLSWRTERLETGEYLVHIQGEDRPFSVSGLDAYSEELAGEEIARIVRHRCADVIEGASNVLYVAEMIHSKTSVESQQEPSKPPILAEMLFAMFAPSKSAGAQLGDLQELYQTELSQLGVQRAQKIYWVRVARSIGPLLYRKLMRIGFIGLLIEWSRSKLGF